MTLDHWLSFVAASAILLLIPGPTVLLIISYALGQGATLVAAVWGIFVWREFQNAPASTKPLIGIMFASYAAGLVLIGLATL